MTEYIAGFICALVLAALVVLWIIYCMFVRERHKTTAQYDISDILRRNQALAEVSEKCPEKKIGLAAAAGVFIIPTRHKQKDDYEHRPDYPESPVPLQSSTDKLVDLLHDTANDDFYKDGSLEIDSKATYISDV